MPTKPVAPPTAVHLQLPHANIGPGENLRHETDYGDLDGLAQSILTIGLLEPLVVRELLPPPVGESPLYRLIAGERRWRAIGVLIESGRLPADFPVDVMVRNYPSDSLITVASILENLMRADIHIVDESTGVARLCGRHGYTLKEAAAAVGHSTEWVRTRLAVAKLPDAAQDRLRSGTLDMATAVLLSTVPVKDRERLASSSRSDIERHLAGVAAVKERRKWMAALDKLGVAEKRQDVSDHDARADHDFLRRFNSLDQLMDTDIIKRGGAKADCFLFHYWSGQGQLTQYRHKSNFADVAETVLPAPAGVDQDEWNAYHDAKQAHSAYVRDVGRLRPELRAAALLALSDKEVVSMALTSLIMTFVVDNSYYEIYVTDERCDLFGVDRAAITAWNDIESADDEDAVAGWLKSHLSSVSKMAPFLRLFLSVQDEWDAKLGVLETVNAELGECPSKLERPTPTQETSDDD